MTPRSTLTFLFTDIERSSELWETHPQAMGRALAQHDRLLTTVFEQQGGKIFKTVGDAFCVAFAQPHEAVNAAFAAQKGLAAASWEETGPLRVRMAVHSGVAELRDNDYFGPTLNRVARVLAVGHGGQTLLTQVVADLVRGALPENVSLRDLGERRLKDLRQPERIFQLVAEVLPDNFPPLRSLEILPNNLPAQVTSFVGREKEMAEVKRLLQANRLVTLFGPGGTGKTRLSLQAAADLFEQFPHGVWLVELSTVTDPELVVEAIINAVRIREAPDRTPLETLVEALRARQLLLVMDNCEHLVAACARIVTALLRGCPQVKVIASSREALSVEGETIWALAPLSLPDYGHNQPTPGLDQLARLEAVQLFVERATAVRQDFRLTTDNAALVARICWRLDGLPLAIELAAARVKLLPLAQILDRLDHRFRLLTGGSRAALPRQQTLGALIDWSHDLLSEKERVLLRRLSVFVRGRTLEMAESVCGVEGLDPAEIFDLLCSLADKSLLMVEAAPDGEPRYTMLESIWDYADEKLVQAGEDARFRRRHLDYFLALAEEAEPHLYRADQKTWVEKLALDHANLNHALRTSLASKETIEPGLRLATAISRYWEIRSYLTEGYEQLQELLAQADDSVAPAVRASAEYASGRLAWCQDRDATAIRHYHTALGIYASLGMKAEAALTEAFLGYSERNDGNNAQAHQHFDRAAAAGAELGLARVRIAVWNGLGTLLAVEGKLAEARRLKEDCIAPITASGDEWVLAAVNGSLGRICLLSDDLPAARKHVETALRILQKLGSYWAVPYALEATADICARENEAAKAVRLYGAASAYRATFALQFSTTERVSYQNAMEQLRALLPGAEFEQEWAAGLTLGYQDAIDLALDRQPLAEPAGARTGAAG